MVEDEDAPPQDFQDVEARPIQGPSALGRVAFVVTAAVFLAAMGVAGYAVWRLEPASLSSGVDEERLEARFTEAAEARRALETRFEDLGAALDALRSDAAAAEAERRGLAQRIASLEDAPRSETSSSAPAEGALDDLDDLGRRVAGLETGQDRLRSDVSATGSRLDELRVDLTDRLDALRDDLAALDGAVDAMDVAAAASGGDTGDAASGDAPSAALGVLARDVSRLEGEVDRLAARRPDTAWREAVDALERRVADLEADVADFGAEAGAAGVSQDEMDARRETLDRRAAALDAAAARLKTAVGMIGVADAIETGAPFPEAFAAYRISAEREDDVVAALRPFAASGAPTDEDLAARLADLAAARDQARGLGERAADLAARLVEVRKDGEGAAAADPFEEAEILIRRGAIRQALAALESVEEASAPGLDAWRAEVAAVQAARETAGELRARARMIIDRAARGVE